MSVFLDKNGDFVMNIFIKPAISDRDAALWVFDEKVFFKTLKKSYFLCLAMISALLYYAFVIFNMKLKSNIIDDGYFFRCSVYLVIFNIALLLIRFIFPIPKQKIIGMSDLKLIRPQPVIDNFLFLIFFVSSSTPFFVNLFIFPDGAWKLIYSMIFAAFALAILAIIASIYDLHKFNISIK